MSMSIAQTNKSSVNLASLADSLLDHLVVDYESEVEEEACSTPQA